MHIVSLQAENIKRLVAVEIKPDGNVVEITGRNGAGKTSVLDSIWWALGGAAGHQKKPIRDGETKARIRLDLGEYVVKREFREVGEDGRYTTRIHVENADGARFTSPQTMLDELLGSLTFDPLAFARMKPADQYEALRTLCGLDFADIDAEIERDYARRTAENRIAKDRTAAAEAVAVDDDLPEEPVNLAELTDQLSQGEKLVREREALARDLEDQKRHVVRLREEAAGHAARAKQYEQQCAEANQKADSLEAAMAKQPDLEPAPDLEPLRKAIAGADAINRNVEARTQRERLRQQAKAAERESEKLTKLLDEHRAAARKRIADADMPVDGLGLADGVVTFEGLPFEQASDALQLRVSCAIAMRENAKLKVIRVRDGSLMDEDSLRVLREMAEAADYQVWVERVDTSGKVGFVIEDGRLAGEASKAAKLQSAGAAETYKRAAAEQQRQDDKPKDGSDLFGGEEGD